MLTRTLFAAGVAAALVTAPAGAQGDAFDAASLESAIKGMRVYKARLADLAAMRVQYLNLQSRRADLSEKNAEQITAFTNRDGEYRECVATKLSEGKREKAQEMHRKVMSLASDPATLQKYTDANQRYLDAATKGDTAAANKALAEMMKLLGFDAKADTAAARAACGAAPRPPVVVAEIERMEKQTDTLAVRIRRAETAADEDGARAAGVSAVRFAQMRERLLSFAQNPGSFTGAEAALLAPRKAEIVELMKTP
jgi:hypothetical protein